MIKSIVALIIFSAIAAALFYFASTPRSAELQPHLAERTDFDYDTRLIIHKDSTLRTGLMLRRVRNSTWKTSGPHTDHRENTYIEPSMAVCTIKPDAYLKGSAGDDERIIIGRFSDRGSGMHGWHVTMIREGVSEINFDRHQRYQVWIEKDHPKGFNDQGEPVSTDPQRWYFAGPADIIAKDQYDGYVEPVEGDR